MYFLLLILGISWGVNFIFMKWAVEFISPMQVVWYRVCFAFIPIALFALVKKQVRLSHFKYWYHYLVMALLANIIIFYFFAKATSVIDSGIAGAISGTIPLFTVMLSIFFLKDEKLSIYKVLGVITGLIGVLIITTPWQASSFKENLLGVTYMTIGSLFYAYSFIYARKFLIPKKISPSALTSYQAFFSLIITTLLVDLSTLFNVFNSTKAMLGSVFGLGLIGTGIAYIIYYKLVEGLGAIKASTVTYIPPVVAIIIGQTFGGESFSISALIGVTIILTGVYITKLSKT